MTLSNSDMWDDYPDDYWDNRRVWNIHNGIINVSDLGGHHPDLPGYTYGEPEGNIYGGKVTSPTHPDYCPSVQRFYDKHFKDLDFPKQSSWEVIKSNLSQTLFDLRKPMAHAQYEAHKAAIRSAEISAQRWAYLNGQVRFGPHHPQLVYELAKDQGLDDAHKMSNLVAIGEWPHVPNYNLAIGEMWNGRPQLFKSNCDRTVVRDAVQAALDKS